MAHPYANAAGYILASDAISQDEYRYKQGGEDDDRRPTHRRRWSFGFPILSLKYGIFFLVDDLEAPLLLFEWKDSVGLDYADFGEHYGVLFDYSLLASCFLLESLIWHDEGLPLFLFPHHCFPVKVQRDLALDRDELALDRDELALDRDELALDRNELVFLFPLSHLPTKGRGYVYPDDTWSVMTPGTPSVMRLGFDGRVGARTPDPFGRGVTPEPFGRRTPEPGRALTGRLTPEFGRAMMRTPEPGGWWAAETSRMWLTPEPDARCSGWAGMGCFTNGKMGCVARMRWKGRQVKKGVKARARKTAAALRRLASAMKGDAKA
ncbi:hypothetical protein EV714DRAFT_272347 [Schizophyllum commune]